MKFVEADGNFGMHCETGHIGVKFETDESDEAPKPQDNDQSEEHI